VAGTETFDHGGGDKLLRSATFANDTTVRIVAVRR